jgi:hypothetical protein
MVMTDSNEITERLRKFADYSRAYNNGIMSEPLATEAADEIEQLRRERDMYRDIGVRQYLRRETAERERDEARAVLKALLKLAHGSFEGTSDKNDALLDQAIAVVGADRRAL